ncbi:hypothetical protein V500_03868 [Pseudogymnoascus sp. VKM F-4518 (FW-2643)]|nr:hypothetical protein V500_03868 [Pseudogymnoascus sp. VKM F-4518 (FW-2643)]
MDKLQKLYRAKQICLARLSTAEKALSVDPGSTSIKASIILLKGELEVTALEMRHAEEDSTEAKTRCVGMGGQEIPAMGREMDPSTADAPQAPTPPTELDHVVLDHDVSRVYTLKDIMVIQGNMIWDFTKRKFASLDVRDRRRSRSLLRQFVTKLCKVTYFKRHACLQIEVEEYLPMELVLRYFSSDEWTSELLKLQSHLHARTLTSALIDGIMVQHWAKHPAYPERTGQSTIEERMEKWKSLVEEDPVYLKWVVAPVADAVDWDSIAEGKTTDDTTLRLWVKASTMMAADTAWVEGRDLREGDRRTGGNAGAYRLNRKWEKFADDVTWASRLDGAAVRITHDFGYGVKTSKKLVQRMLGDEGTWTDSGSEGGHPVVQQMTAAVAGSLDRSFAAGESGAHTPKKRKRKAQGQLTEEDLDKRHRRRKGVAAGRIIRDVENGGDGPLGVMRGGVGMEGRRGDERE